MIFKNLDLEKKNLNFLSKKSIYVFNIENFLGDYFYNILKNNFPKIPEEKMNNFDIKKNNYKLPINSTDDPFYKKIIENNNVLLDFHNFVFSKNFFKFFFKKLYMKILISRKNDFKFFLKILRPLKLNSEKKIFNFLYASVSPQIEYSYIFNNGKIVPHTDSRAKLLSLMLYFPDESQNLLTQKNFGTTFWSSAIKNRKNIHLASEINPTDENGKDFPNIENFKKQNKIICNVPYEKNNLYGFIGSDTSWHSVEKINLNNSYVRRSININFNLS